MSKYSDEQIQTVEFLTAATRFDGTTAGRVLLHLATVAYTDISKGWSCLIPKSELSSISHIKPAALNRALRELVALGLVSSKPRQIGSHDGYDYFLNEAAILNPSEKVIRHLSPLPPLPAGEDAIMILRQLEEAREAILRERIIEEYLAEQRDRAMFGEKGPTQ